MATGAKRVHSSPGHNPWSKTSAPPRSRRPSVDDLTLRAQAMTIRLLLLLLPRTAHSDNGMDAAKLAAELEEAAE